MPIFHEFPYGNMHDQNMDWILKVVKEFLNKYQTVENLIQQAVDAINEGKTEALEEIDVALTAAINDITSSQASALNAIGDSKDSALASIATALGNATDAISTLGTTVQTEITTLKNTSISEINTAQGTAISAINASMNHATTIIEQLYNTLPASAQDILGRLDLLDSIITGNTMESFTWLQGDYVYAEGVTPPTPPAIDTDSVNYNYLVSNRYMTGVGGRRLRVITDGTIVMQYLLNWRNTPPGGSPSAYVPGQADYFTSTYLDLLIPFDITAISLTLSKPGLSATLSPTDIDGHIEIQWITDFVSQRVIAPKETSLTANVARLTNELFFYEGVLYKALDDIDVGDTIVISGAGANCEETTVGYELYKELDDIADALSAANSAESGVTSLQGDMTTAQSDITSLQGDMNTAQSDITSLQDDMNTAQSDITSLQDDMNTTQSDITSLQDDMNTAKSDITSLENDKANKNGTYNTLTAGNLYTIEGYEEKSAYISRKSGGTKVYAQFENDKVIGGTVVWNQQCNNPSETSAEVYGITWTFTPNSVKVNGTATSDSIYALSTWIPIDIPSGHKVLNLVSPTDGEGKLYTEFALRAQDNSMIYDVRTNTPNIQAINANATSLYVSVRVYSGVTISNYTTTPPMIIDLTKMFGSAIADYIYSLETATPGAGVAWFKALFSKDYYTRDTGTLRSVQTSAHVMRDANNTIIGNYQLDSNLILRGLPKLDANNNLFYDGDEYESNGTVTRRYEQRAYQAGDESLTDAVTDGTNTVVKLTTPTTETAEPFTNPQKVNIEGKEQYLDAGNRDVDIPVGSNAWYFANLKAKIEHLPWDMSMIATVLNDYTADANLVSNDFRIVNNTLYKITANISKGQTITPGTNAQKTNVCEVLKSLLGA